MCRHLAYLGPPASLSSLLLEPPHSLLEQSYAPRLQRHGTMNVDGFGAGWYVPNRPEPVRYRRGQPIWTDQSFASLAPTVESTCVLAAVRSADPSSPSDESCAAPFAYDTWLFSHNGRVADMERTRTLLPTCPDVPDALAGVDSAFLFGIAVARWRKGASLGTGLAGVVSDVAVAGGGRLNLLATDGYQLAATSSGDTLYLQTGANRVVLASEPINDGEWTEIPDDTLVEASPDGVVTRQLTVECP